MTDHGVRAAITAMPVEEQPVDGGQADYADAFEVRLPVSDGRTAEQWARCALEEAPPPVQWTVYVAHRYVLRLRLGPRPSPDHVFGWTILTAEPDLIRLEASSPLIRGLLVLRRADPTSMVLTTFVFFHRRRLARVVWHVVTPLHRAVARYLLARAAVNGPSPRPAAPAEAVSATGAGPGASSRPRRPFRAGAAGSRRGSSAWRRR